MSFCEASSSSVPALLRPVISAKRINLELTNERSKKNFKPTAYGAAAADADE